MAKPTPEFIDSMCMTWRHDFGLVRGDATHAGYYGIGMTEAEREGLRNSMRQIWEHCIEPFAIRHKRAARHGALQDAWAIAERNQDIETRDAIEDLMRSEGMTP